MTGTNVRLYLVDGTYELFRAYFAMPPSQAPGGQPTGAVRGLVQTLLSLLRRDQPTHIACAFDHVIESFRNRMFAGYKTGEGTPQELLDQFGLAERATESLGIAVWPMTEFEADDALAAAAVRWADAPGMEQVIICSPDKDLAQVVQGSDVVCLDRHRNQTMDSDGVVAKFGVHPESIPDYLALVGDSADGIPGIPRWGAKSTAQVLAHYTHLEAIPDDVALWDVELRGAPALAASLAERRDDAVLYKQLATLRVDTPLPHSLDELEWRGVPREKFMTFCAELGLGNLADAPHAWRD